MFLPLSPTVADDINGPRVKVSTHRNPESKILRRNGSDPSGSVSFFGPNLLFREELPGPSSWRAADSAAMSSGGAGRQPVAAAVRPRCGVTFARCRPSVATYVRDGRAPRPCVLASCLAVSFARMIESLYRPAPDLPRRAPLGLLGARRQPDSSTRSSGLMKCPADGEPAGADHRVAQPDRPPVLEQG